MLGRKLKSPLDLLCKSVSTKKVHFDPTPQVEQKQQEMKIRFDKRTKARYPHFLAGDMVRVKIPNPKTNLHQRGVNPDKFAECSVPLQLSSQIVPGGTFID